MTENIYHRYLTLPFEFTKPEKFNYAGERFAVAMEESDVYQPFREWIQSLGLELSNILEAFYTCPGGSDVPLHADPGMLPGTADVCKLNFTWGPEDSTTRWYKIRDETKYEKFYGGTASGSNKKFYKAGINPDIDIDYSIIADFDDCDLVYEAVINKPSLINVGQLHSTWNPGDEYRWTFCFVLLENNEPITMERGCEIFKNYIDN